MCVDCCDYGKVIMSLVCVLYARSCGCIMLWRLCILTSCSSVLCVLMALGMFMFVKVMSSLMSMMSPPLCCVCGYI